MSGDDAPQARGDDVLALEMRIQVLEDSIRELTEALARQGELRRQQLTSLRGERDHLAWELRMITSSRGWRAVRRYRALHHAALGPLRRRARGPGQPSAAIEKRPGSPREDPAGVPGGAASPEDKASAMTPGAGRPPAGEPRPLATADDPLVSIIIPVHGRIEATLACLDALTPHLHECPCEVIVVDDASPDGSAESLSRIEGLRIVRREVNGGFVEAIRSGAESARGSRLLFLNNDTMVRPGWLHHLLAAVESAPDVGAAGSKLVFPNGILQEAGGIVWRDGSVWNWGHGEDPDAPQYNTLRDVDYCSAASLMVRRDVYERVGGVDPRYRPAYYEDVDLCLTIREHGHRVLYQPLSVVLHHGGLSYPKDPDPEAVEDSRLLRRSANHRLFAAKWASTLQRHWPEGTAGGLLGGRIDHRPCVLLCDAQEDQQHGDPGCHRMRGIAAALASAGARVTLIPGRPPPDPSDPEPLRSMGIEVWRGPEDIRLVCSQRPGFYDLAILEDIEVAHAYFDLIRRSFPKAVLAYDAPHVHHRTTTAANDGGDDAPDAEAARRRLAELSAMRAADIVTTASETDRAVAARLVIHTPVMTLTTAAGEAAPRRAMRHQLLSLLQEHVPHRIAGLSAER